MHGAGPTLDAESMVDGPEGGLEHRRIVGIARRRLFGSAAPVCIGRYVIERRLGAGGMGEVYLARDEALDRWVAVKRVRTPWARAREQERLRREARALARLSHPHVVQVYEVGEHEGQTFIAMEYVDGQTLGQWLAEEPRSWRAALEVLMASGRGLAAAHDAGLVHRDFKPDNVLLGRDGSVRVADFGLALAGEDLRERGDPAPTGRARDDRLSAAGTIVGTIRYMSYEQLCGYEVDARSDQFAFCLVAYEALWGESPFSLTSVMARLAALSAPVSAVPRTRPGARVPKSLWRVIRRGLSKEPAQRWPDMHGLLAAIERVLYRRRRWRLGSLVTAVSLGGVALAAGREAPADACAEAERQLAQTWDEPRREALREWAAGLGADHVEGSRQRVSDGLDRWATQWVEVRERTCRGAADRRVGPRQAQAQDACLLRQRHAVGELVGLLLEPGASADALAGAVDVVMQLPPASACEDDLALLGVELPAAHLVEPVQELRRDLDRARHLRWLGRLEEALRLAERTEASARALDHEPLWAEALGERAMAEIAAGSLRDALEHLQQAVDAAERTRHDHLAAELWAELAARTVIDLADREAGQWQLRRAEVAQGRVGQTPLSRVRLLATYAVLSKQRGDHTEAERIFRSALAEAEQDESMAFLVPYHRSSVAKLVAERDPATAREMFDAALDEVTSLYGARHPRTAEMSYLAATVLEGERPEYVAPLLRRAVEIWAQTHARPHANLARAHLILGRYALEQGQLDRATSHADAVASILDLSMPSDSIEYANLAKLRSVLASVTGDGSESIRQARIAIERLEQVEGPDSPEVLQLRGMVASSLLELGRVDEADVEFGAVLELGAGRGEETVARLGRCEVHVMRGDLERADAQLQSLEHLSHDELGGHEFSYALLRALVDLRRGTLRPATQQQLQVARGRSPFSSSQLSRWFEQLGLTAAERASLELQ